MYSPPWFEIWKPFPIFEIWRELFYKNKRVSKLKSKLIWIKLSVIRFSCISRLKRAILSLFHKASLLMEAFLLSLEVQHYLLNVLCVEGSPRFKMSMKFLITQKKHPNFLEMRSGNITDYKIGQIYLERFLRYSSIKFAIQKKYIRT